MSTSIQSQKQSAVNVAAAGPASDTQSQASLGVKNLWQHPFVDVFKHFKIIPVSDWKQNKKQGDVQEIFAKEIGRKAISMNGSISANNFIQIPSPTSAVKTLGLSGRYLYLQAKAPLSSSPFSFHFDLQLADRSHGVRISASNLYKSISTQNGFVIQVPLNMDMNRWTVTVFDIYEILRISAILPTNYQIEGGYQIRNITLCACSVVRGIFTSDNLYDFVTSPPDMRFKFQFEINKWPEQFAWLELPGDLKPNATEDLLTSQRREQTRANAALKGQNANTQGLTDRQKEKMEAEITEMLQAKQNYQNPTDTKQVAKKSDFNQLQQQMQSKFHSNDEMLSPDEQLGFSTINKGTEQKRQHDSAQVNQNNTLPYTTGQYIGQTHKRSPKLNLDPVMELKHVIGYSPDKCLNIKWSKIAGENVVMFTSGGTIIVMDVEDNVQKRFFFGHSAPICCFDVSQQGGLVASAQEGKNSIIRIWDYYTARCLSMVTMPVTSLKCVAFSPDGRFLASVGKDTHNKEMIIIWDISKITRGEKPEIAAKQTTEFNILSLKFSPIDNNRLVSCGKENIRFWRIKETNNIRGSAVVLNHHARNTVFTSLDFEWGARATVSHGAINPNSKENESLKRVFVASKHGMVFQINYLTEALEATYRTNDSAIYSIAVNEAFCVTGSDDQYLRVWPLDFSEFFMEAKHEGTVCATDISSDGLRVVCGTLYGSLGILDKSNQRYRTLIRSHTNSILSMDFHIPKRNIISVSSDSTIRLWDLENYDQVVEFSSPIDEPLCVAAHPTLPIFSCGFKSGTMRVFDIEKTCVADEFVQFNKPIRKLCYSKNGEILVTCCEDGSVAIHNARRQHLPIKMLHLEFPSQFVHVAFSSLIRKQTQRDFTNDDDEIHSLQNELRQGDMDEISLVKEIEFSWGSLFGLMGEYGNNLMIYDTDSIILKNQIQAGFILKSFQFAQGSSEVILVTNDQRIRFYSLARFEGIFLRELTTCHRGQINTTDLSLNGGFMLTGGSDNLIKIWDYEAQKSTPYFYQAFIGHTFPISDVMFNPCDNNTVISTADKDGIYFWQFHGDTHTNYLPIQDEQQVQEVVQIDKNAMHQPTTLEKMRLAVKSKKNPKLAEFSFIVSPFEPAEQIDHSLQTLGQITQSTVDDSNGLQSYYDAKVREKELSFNHFVSVQDKKKFEVEIEKKSLLADASEGRVIEPTIVNGYDGFGGAHENLLWNANQGTIVYTLNNKVIKENTKTRQQNIFADSTVRLSCLAQSENGKIVAAAEGETNASGNSYIYLYDMDTHKLINRLTFHQKGVQAVAFADKGKVLISLGVSDENALAVWDISQGLVLKSALIPGHSTNQIIVNKQESEIQFCTVGNKGSFTFWRVDPDSGDLQFSEISLPNSLDDTDFVCASFTQIMPAPFNRSLLLLGSADGAIVAFDPENQEFIEFGNKKYIMQGQIGTISARNNSVVLSSSTGMIVKYPIVLGNIYPPEEKGQLTSLKAEGPITSLVMDELNIEGILGTSLGNVFYINIQEQVLIKLISRVSPLMDNIKVVRYDPTNQAIFLSTCGKNSGEVKIYTSVTLDQVMCFPQYALGPVSFICASAKNRRLRMIGHERGVLKLVAVDSLKVEAMYQLVLAEGETLTTGVYSPSGLNFAVGTSHGVVYLGNYKKDKYGHNIMRMSKLHGLTLTQDNAVTSIQLSSFDPIGCLLVAFDNGQVRTWQSTMRNEQFTKLMEGKNKPVKGKSKQTYDIAELGPVQFDIIDKFDMFQNPHGLEAVTDEDEQQLLELYGVSKIPHLFVQGKTYPECEALFAPGSSCVDHYFCYVSALQYLFVRNYVAKQTIRRVSLMYFPTSLQLVDYYKLATELDLPIRGGGLQALTGVGTREGKVLVYRVDSQETKLLSKTKGGLIFGAVASLSIMENGTSMVVSSESGELLSFDLISTIKDRQEQI